MLSAFPVSEAGNEWIGFIANLVGIGGVFVSLTILLRVRRISTARIVTDPLAVTR